MNWELVFKALLTIILCVITGVVIPWIKSKIGAENFAQVEKWAKIAVQAAEMIYTESGKGQLKKEYVIEFLPDLLAKANIKLSAEELNNVIESAVKELKLKESVAE